MSLTIVQGDITKLKVDAIVNAANNTLLGGSGVDGCIHRAAGPELLAECRTLHGCATGKAKITKGYNLPAKYVIHTVGPIWSGKQTDGTLLANCFINSLNLAKEYKCKSLAFPLISTGVYGYPKDEALNIATQTIKNFLDDNDLKVYLVLFKKEDLRINTHEFAKLREYITLNYWDEKQEKANFKYTASSETNVYDDIAVSHNKMRGLKLNKRASFPLKDIAERVSNIDESFSQMLLRKIDELDMTDAQCYKKANVDRKLFSKIRSNVHYRPRKSTAVAFALALNLSEEETRELLEKAGYSLSRSSIFDVIILYYVQKGVYDIYEINEALFAYDQSLLGTK